MSNNFVLTMLIIIFFVKIFIHFLAYGFGLIKGSIVVYATLINKQLESRTINVNNNELKFTSNCIWYLDNATLKK